MKKYIQEHKVNRMRNLISKKHNDKTKIQVGYGKNKGEHIEGDIWEERGKKWTIKNGITQSITKLKEARKKILTPLFCPDCGGLMKGQMTKKMWKLYEKCTTCVFDYEGELKMKGGNTFANYEKEKMASNHIDWLKDVKAYATNFIESINREGYITERGKVENWSKQDKAAIIKKVNKRIAHIESEINEKWLDNITKD